MKTFGYTPYGSYNAIKLFVNLSDVELHKLSLTYKEWICFTPTYQSKKKIGIEGILPHASMSQWLSDLQIAMAKSKVHFAQQAVINLEATHNGTKYHYLEDSYDALDHADAFDANDALEDDLPF